MKPVQKILFPADLSAASPRIVPWVKAMAERFDAEVIVLFVARVFGHYSGMGVPYAFVTDFEAEIIKGARQSLDNFMNNHFKGVRARPELIRGYPAEEILNFAREESVDLIIIGTHGRKGLERILFGSVAEHVVKNSPVPVLTVNPYRTDAAEPKPDAQ
ncbi:MAG: universal stress protein [Thermodesulfobacteriota bacterium]